jgi:hypothetical protein
MFLPGHKHVTFSSACTKRCRRSYVKLKRDCRLHLLPISFKKMAIRDRCGVLFHAIALILSISAGYTDKTMSTHFFVWMLLIYLFLLLFVTLSVLANRLFVERCGADRCGFLFYDLSALPVSCPLNGSLWIFVGFIGYKWTSLRCIVGDNRTLVSPQIRDL